LHTPALPRRALARLALVTLAIAPLASASAGAAAAARPLPPAQPKVGSWQIGKLEVISRGRVKQMREGRLVDGYTLKAPARARPGAPAGDGTLVVTLGSFSPVKDLPHQPTGFHYVKGTWRLLPEGVTSVPAKHARATELLSGHVTAALPRDPTEGKGGFTLRMRLTRAAAGVKLGDGTLTVDDALGAELTLTYR
jgi:hypothetical protein